MPRYTIARLLAMSTVAGLCIVLSDRPTDHLIWLLLAVGILLPTAGLPEEDASHGWKRNLRYVGRSAFAALRWGTLVGAIVFPAALLRANLLFRGSISLILSKEFMVYAYEWGFAILFGAWLGGLFAACGGVAVAVLRWCLSRVPSITTVQRRGFLRRTFAALPVLIAIAVPIMIAGEYIRFRGEMAAVSRLRLQGATVGSLRDSSPVWARRLSSVYGLPPISGGFQRVHITSTQSLTSLRPLARLTKLDRLYVVRARVSDLTPLARLGKLKSLTLEHTAVTDLTPLAKLENLESLKLAHTQVSDLAPLAGLGKLKELDISYSSVSDLSPLANCRNLESLALNGTSVTDLAPLDKLRKLRDIRMQGTRIADLSVLGRLPNLQTVHLGPGVKDLRPLATVSELWFDPDTTSLPSLTGLPSLSSISLKGTGVSDLSALRVLTGLVDLDVSDSRVVDLSPLKGLTWLEQLSIKNTRVSDLSPLNKVPGLRQIWIGNAPVTNLAAVRKLPAAAAQHVARQRLTDAERASFRGKHDKAIKIAEDLVPLVDYLASFSPSSANHRLTAATCDVLATGYQRKKRYDKAIRMFAKGIAAAKLAVSRAVNGDVSSELALADLYLRSAHLLATCSEVEKRNGPEALRRASAAQMLFGNYYYNSFLTSATLAAAYAETGRFKKAVEWQKDALALAPTPEIEDQMRKRLLMFQASKPLRE